MKSSGVDGRKTRSKASQRSLLKGKRMRGATIMAMSQIGIPYAHWNQDGRFVFLGVVLLLAVLVNNAVRKRAQEAR